MGTEPFTAGGLGDGSGRLLETSAAGTPDIASARRDATAHLRRWGCSNEDDAILVLSELVTNAVLHAGGARRIRVDCAGGRIRISVHDADPRPARMAADVPAVGGRGLRIVARLSRRWGSAPLGGGKDVWAELSCTSAAPPAGDVAGAT